MRTSRVAHHRFRFVYLNKEAFFKITQQFDAYYTVDNTIFKIRSHNTALVTSTLIII